MSRFISGSELSSLGSNATLCDQLERILRTQVRDVFEEYIANKIHKKAARGYCVMIETQLIRLALNKSLKAGYPGGVVGKFSEDKAAQLISNWAKHLEKDSDDLSNMLADLGMADNEIADDPDDVSMLIKSPNLVGYALHS